MSNSSSWFEGPYSVKDRVGRVSAGIKPGEILIRCQEDGEPSGLIALRCPACLSVQFRHGYVQGPDDRPTVDRVLTCGCKSMCGAQFQILAGKSKKVTPSDKIRPPIPERLLRAGVKFPPKINCD